MLVVIVKAVSTGRRGLGLAEPLEDIPMTPIDLLKFNHTKTPGRGFVTASGPSTSISSNFGFFICSLPQVIGPGVDDNRSLPVDLVKLFPKV
jgi:hypothetical protein